MLPLRFRVLAAWQWMFAAIGVAGLQACAREPVRWDESVQQVATASDGDLLRVDAGGLVAVPAVAVPDLPDACPGSSRTAQQGAERYVVWWRAAPSRSASLMFARSRDSGATWSTPVLVDSSDTGTRGCERPAPGIAAGEGSAYVHVVYWLEPASGAGVYFSHSMDGGGMFHAPVAVAYGGQPSLAAVASLGDTVFVAHEDPNSARPRLLMALSRSAGHIFEHRFGLPATSSPQSSPRIAVTREEVLVGWREPGGPTLFVRRGRWGAE